MRRLFRIALIGITLILLVACASETPDSTTQAPQAVATVPPEVAGTPEDVMRQMLAALDADDVATITQLIDPQLEQRDVSIRLVRERWKQRRRSRDVSKDYDALGSATSVNILDPEQRGEVTVIRAVIEHEHGADDLTLTLKPTSTGYMVVQWNTELVRDARGRTHKP